VFLTDASDGEPGARVKILRRIVRAGALVHDDDVEIEIIDPHGEVPAP
jgi:hypothetical protein